jgi:hypothetical protein
VSNESRRAEPIAGIHDLVSLRLPARPIGGGVEQRTALSYSDHLLRRFGQADIVHLEHGGRLEKKEEETADEVWALIEGEATFEWEDRRSSSPTSGGKASLAAREPIAVLVPFGVAFRVTAGNGAAILLRLSTDADDEERLPRPFREEPFPQ